MSTEQEASPIPGTAANGVKRREFLKVLGVGTAATTMLGCASEKVEKLIPYLVSPDQTVPGVSTYYATTCRECSVACGLIAETRDGRTIKLEGNPDHPVNRGALCARGQSALQGLYNPDRYRGPMVRRNGQLHAVTWDEALQVFAQKLGETRSRGAAGAVFINQHESGSFPGFLDAWLAGFGMPAHLSYDAGADHAAIAANRQSYGVAWPRLDFRAARLVVSIGADFLDSWGAMVPQQLDFADARADHERAPRLIYVGPRRSLTGLNADQWIDCRPGSEMAIVHMLGGQLTSQQASQATGVAATVLDGFAREFAATKPSMVFAGGSGADGLEVALAANALNQSQGNVGVTIKPKEGYLGFDRMAAPAELRALADRMNSGGVSLLMVRGANPAFTLPKSAGFAAAMAKVPFKVSFSSYPDASGPDSSRPSLSRAVGRRRADSRNDLSSAADDGSRVRHARDFRCVDRCGEEGPRERSALPSGRLSLLVDQPLPGRSCRTHGRSTARDRLRFARRAHDPSPRSRCSHHDADRAVERKHVPRRLFAPLDRRRPRRKQAVAAGDP